jgi:hypothetical protein
VHLIQQIGSYAGLAAIPGLAVLSALYFSQARDVKRLRDWAGRAPERAAEQAAGGRVVAQPQEAAQPGASAAPAVPGVAAAKPAAGAGAPAAAAAPGAKPAVAGKTAAVTPAGVAAAAAAAKAGQGGAAAAGATALGDAATVDPVASSAPAAAASTGAGAATTTGGGEGANGTATRPGPPAVGGVKPATPGAAAAAGAGKPATAAAKPAAASGASGVRRPIPRITGAQTSILPPGASSRAPWYRRLAARLPAGRYIALIVAGALVLGGGAAFGITQLASNGSSSKSSTPSGGGGGPAQSSSSGGKHHTVAAPAITPSSVTVTVVNGTNIANLARDTASKLSRLGFQIGNTVTGTGPLAAAESVVEYKPGARDKAVFVAAKLHINQKQPADSDALAQAGPADVIVVLGADQAPGG